MGFLSGAAKVAWDVLSGVQGWVENSTPVITGGIYRYFPAWQIRLKRQILLLANITFLPQNAGKYEF